MYVLFYMLIQNVFDITLPIVFGNTAPLFGNTASNTGNIFGNNQQGQQQPQQQGQLQTGNVFGGLFGKPMQANAPLFGSGQPQGITNQTQQNPPSLFGSSFGQSTQPSSLFANKAAAPMLGNSFSGSQGMSTGIFGASANLPGAQGTMTASTYWREPTDIRDASPRSTHRQFGTKLSEKERWFFRRHPHSFACSTGTWVHPCELEAAWLRILSVFICCWRECVEWFYVSYYRQA
jgi:hypothetical protein